MTYTKILKLRKRALKLCAHVKRSSKCNSIVDLFYCDAVDNLGDYVMLEATKKLFPSAKIRPHLGEDESWANLSRRFGITDSRPRPLLLGGGTLLGADYFLDQLDRTLPYVSSVSCLGTGVGSSGFGMEDDHGSTNASKRIADIVSQFKLIKVRGPRSKARLESAGISGVEVCGDMALALTPKRCPVEERRTVMLSLTGNSQLDTKMHILADALGELVKEGFQIQPVSVSENDTRVTNEFIKTLPFKTLPNRLVSRNLREFGLLASKCHSVIGVRLHAVILGCCFGANPVMLSYRDKGFDYMDSIDASNHCTSIYDLTSPEFILRSVVDSIPPEEIHRRCYNWRIVQAAAANQIAETW